MSRYSPVTLNPFVSGPRQYLDHSERNESPIHDCAHCGVNGLTVGLHFTRDSQRYKRQICADCWHALIPLFQAQESDVPMPEKGAA